MFLDHITISNFRGIDNLSLQFDKTTILIGENNTCKSTILDALQLVLDTTRNKTKFEEYDHPISKNNIPKTSDNPIEITLYFSEQSDNEWSNEIVQGLRDIVQFDDSDRNHVILQVQSKYDATTNESNPEWAFLDLNGNKMGVNIGKN